MNPSQYYLSHFSIDEKNLCAIVAEALRSGGDYCDLYFEDTAYTDLLLRDGIVSSGGSHIDYGCGIRVLKGEKTGYSYSESTDLPSLVKAARSAAAISDSPSPAGHTGLSGTKAVPSPYDSYPMDEDWRLRDAGEFIPVLRKLDSLIKGKDPRVHKVIAALAYQVSEIMMFNSFGELACDTRPLGSLSVSVVFMQDGKVETKSVSKSFRTGAGMLTEELVNETARLAVEGIDRQFDARRPKGGQMSVVMGAGASGILLHEAMGHAFEADFNRKGQSVFADKMGRRICSKGLNIIDDGTLAGNRGSCNFDDEGVPGQKTYMVEDGVLKSFLHDRISAKFFGVSPTGNGRRESFRYNPIPRMRTTYMESGSDGTLDDIISGVRKGIYVDQFANGQVKIGEGDFTFYVKSGSLIENGRLTMPVKDINIIGNGPQALADIIAVATDLRIDDSTWTCGKEQSVPVGCGIPSVLVKNLTVGGE